MLGSFLPSPWSDQHYQVYSVARSRRRYAIKVVRKIENQNREWNGWKPVWCLEGRRSIQLSYGRVDKSM